MSNIYDTAIEHKKSKKALFEKMENECDIIVAEEAYNEYVNDGKKSRPVSELWKELE